MIKSERSLLVQIHVCGVEADNQEVQTKTVKNNGEQQI